MISSKRRKIAKSSTKIVVKIITSVAMKKKIRRKTAPNKTLKKMVIKREKKA